MDTTITRRSALSCGAAAVLGAALSPRTTMATAAETTPTVSMAPGSYVGRALGNKGLFELPVTVTVNETSIIDIQVPEDHFEHGETTPILNSVRDRMFPRIIASQSLDVDAITGATISSFACKQAIEDALRQALVAGGSSEDAVEAFHTSVPRAEEGVVEDVNVDLLVVGLSIGGCFALKSAVDRMQELNDYNRVSVMAIDRAGKIGGRSCLTHGMQNVNPSWPIEHWNNGEPYIDPEAYYSMWLDWVTDEDGTVMANADVFRMFMEHSGETLDWQIANGWRVGGVDPEGPQPGMIFFHTMPAPFQQPGTFEDRRIVVDAFLKQFTAAAEAQGARIELETEGYELLYDEATATVTGVKARNTVTGKEYLIHAKAVVMGTGGFGSNPQMMEELLEPPYNGYYPSLGTNTDTGLMVQAALNIGAGTCNIGMSPMVMHIGLPHFLKKYPINVDRTKLNNFTGRYDTWTLNDAPLGLGLSANQLAVSPQGERFCDESAIMALFAKDIYHSAWPSFSVGQYFYSLWSKKALDEVAEQGLNKVGRWEVYQSQGGVPREMPVPEIFECLDACIEEGMAWKADTIEDLAAQLEMDPAVLGATVNRYNELCNAGADDDFEKAPEMMDALEEGPFYAVKLMNVIFCTLGGLAVDTQVRVCQQDGVTPINGLYAFGSDSAGNLYNPKQNYTMFPAMAAGWNQTGGRQAALNAVDYVAATYGLAEVTAELLPADMQAQGVDTNLW